ncbi:MAG: hypothetical protein KF802_10075 [Bdellovibrionaceae bacterium]|nr:hypothetical protein [Pseudobdellovibrionaceae bacterium]MBX3033758.1 hypothetical protein [Pseudobdellovibrionaceae bacterium]
MVRASSQIATVVFLLAALGAPKARADVLFEGYSKILSGGVHVGYVVSRYEYDPRKKQFRGAYFLKTGALGSDVTESLKAVADVDLKPVSYEYTSMVGKKTKTIDAKFSKDKMTAVLTEEGKSKTIRNDLPKGTFLSNFLVYLMLKSKNGLQAGTRYEYTAIAEEDASIVKGDALVEKEEKYKGFAAYKILNRFKDSKFTSYVAEKGGVLGTVTPANSINVELVAKPNEAVGGFGMNAAIMKSVFGDVPVGTTNPLSQAAKEEALPATPAPAPGKSGGASK